MKSTTCFKALEGEPTEDLPNYVPVGWYLRLHAHWKPKAPLTHVAILSSDILVVPCSHGLLFEMKP